MAVGPATSFRPAPGAAQLNGSRCAWAGFEQCSHFFGRGAEGKTCPDWPDRLTRCRSARFVPCSGASGCRCL